MGIALMSIFVGASYGLSDLSSKQIELNDTIEQKNEFQLKSINEKSGLSGTVSYLSISDGIEMSNTSSEDVKIIQFRMYYFNGTLVQTYDVEHTISPFSKLGIDLNSIITEDGVK